ncbi:MAG: 30S ribosomal protein S12 methylthiotransferase RimO [Actinomycetota bacterium]
MSSDDQPTRTFHVTTLGCPKNQVDSDKLTGTLLSDGLVPAASPDEADVVVVNTCAFIGPAREESVNTILELDELRKDGAELVVTGCMAERYGDELAEALPEVERIAPFGAALVNPALAPEVPPASSTTSTTSTTSTAVPVVIGATRAAPSTSQAASIGAGEPTLVTPSFDLLELPRPKAAAPWAYVKVAEGCDRACGFCAIPSFRGPQRSRSMASILGEVEALEVAEVVLVAQDLAAYGRDQGQGERSIVPLVQAVAERAEWVRLLYLYPSDLTDELVETMAATGVPYFDLSLQHVSRPLMRRMRRWGSGELFSERIATIRRQLPDATFRSNFIVGYPGETEADHDALLAFVDEVQLDWCGFFAYSEEEGTHGATLEPKVPPTLIAERLAELSERQDRITALGRDARIGTDTTVLVDSPGEARSTGEAPEIDGIISVPTGLAVGTFHRVTITDSLGPDLVAEPCGSQA